MSRWMTSSQKNDVNAMNEKQILQRKIELKGQALRLIRAEREQMKHRLHLLRFRDNLLKRIASDFDPELSRKLDCVDFLLRG
jgi:hypothetical protein